MADPGTHYEDSGIPQPWHLVHPSPWPLLGALAAGLLAAAAVMYLHQDKIVLAGLSVAPGIDGVLVGFVLVLAVMALWWRDVIREGIAAKGHSAGVNLGLHTGMVLFISSEVMFFVAFFWAYYSAALFPPAILGGLWPPSGIAAPEPLGMPLAMTIILLSSGLTVTWAHHAARSNHRGALRAGLALTVALGAAFTLCQAWEYAHADFSLSSGMFGSTFFMATGFHGFHVIIGTIFLAICLGRAAKGQFSPERHFGLTAAAWYWHFVDVVWLFLFVSIYWYGSK